MDAKRGSPKSRLLRLCVGIGIWLGLFHMGELGAAEMEDVVYLKYGNIIRGMIVSQVPNKELTIVTGDGNRFTFELEEVQRITKEPVTGRRSRRSSSQADVESWYTLWGLGISSLSYGSEIDELLDFMEGLPGVDRTTISMDLLGFYVPTSDGRSLIGGIVNVFGDRIDYEGEWFQINGAECVKDFETTRCLNLVKHRRFFLPPFSAG